MTTVYIAGVFEFIENGATDKITKYYEGNAMRRSGYGVDDGVFYLLQDQLNSSSGFVDQAGNTIATNYYYPYGGNRGSAAFSGLSTKRFTGQYHESSLPGGEGLSYYNARWYDAKLGRFLSADSIVPGPANPQTLNRYSYVLNNPMRYTDPSGHEPIHHSNYPCSYTACVKDPMTGNNISVSNWTPELHEMYYGEKFGDRSSLELPPELQAITGVMERAVHMELHYDGQGNFDPRKTLETELGEALSVCAKAISGVCGASLGANGALLVGPGLRGSIDFYVDQNEDIALYGTLGGGGYAVFTAINVTAKGISGIAVRNATVDDMSNMSVQFGVSGKAVEGLAVEWIAGRNAVGEYWHGISVGESSGYGAEIHATGTYSELLYRSQKR